MPNHLRHLVVFCFCIYAAGVANAGKVPEDPQLDSRAGGLWLGQERQPQMPRGPGSRGQERGQERSENRGLFDGLMDKLKGELSKSTHSPGMKTK